MQAAEDRIRALKASGTATQADVRQAVLEFAAARIRHLKAQNAPQEEVKAAVEKLLAHEAIPFNEAEASSVPVRVHVESKSAGEGDVLVDAEVAAAERKIRTLKASSTSTQEEVRRAILDYAEARVRSAKARRAPQEEVKAEVDRLLELEKLPLQQGASAPQTRAAQAQTSNIEVQFGGAEAKTSGESKAGKEAEQVQAAETKVRSLKEKGAPQAEVRRAVLEYAEARILYLKAISAPQAEVKQAVEKLLAVESLPFKE